MPDLRRLGAHCAIIRGSGRRGSACALPLLLRFEIDRRNFATTTRARARRHGPMASPGLARARLCFSSRAENPTKVVYPTEGALVYSYSCTKPLCTSMNNPLGIFMNSEEDITTAAQALILTLKRLHEELLGLDTLVHEEGRALYDAVALEEWLDITGVLSNLSARSGAISKLCLDIHFQVRSSRRSHGQSGRGNNGDRSN
jgi:hypothetical protein